MALITGTLGGITLDTGYSTGVTGWTVNVDIPAQETTSWDDYSSGLWRTFVQGVRSWSGTVTCRWDPTVSVLGAIGSEVSLDLHLDATGSSELGVGGSAQLTGIAGSVDMETPGEVTFTFQGTGALTADTTA